MLQQGEYTTVGGRTPIKTNVRIVAATNKDLRFAIQQGAFREDLFFRLNVVPIRLPPLRERPEDIPDLVRAFFQRVRRRDFRSRHSSQRPWSVCGAIPGLETCANLKTSLVASPRYIPRM